LPSVCFEWIALLAGIKGGALSKLASYPYCHIVNHIMKTTLDLPDDLLVEAKAVAARRRTTLKELVTKSLSYEIGLEKRSADFPEGGPFATGALGMPVLKKRDKMISSEDVRRLLEEAEEEDFQNAMQVARGAK
jgi:hypothetical protein